MVNEALDYDSPDGTWKDTWRTWPTEGLFQATNRKKITIIRQGCDYNNRKNMLHHTLWNQSLTIFLKNIPIIKDMVIFNKSHNDPKKGQTRNRKRE